MKLLMVGGGKAAVLLLDYFASLSDVRVVAVVDLNRDAPGMQHAVDHNIETSADMVAQIERLDVDTILEITGNPQVLDTIARTKRSDQEVIPSGVARLLYDLLSERDAQNREAISRITHEFDEIHQRLSTAAQKVDAARSEVSEVIASAEMVSINGRIEAVRAGEAGRAFSIVMEYLQRIIRNVKDTTATISAASAESHRALTHLKTVEQELKKTFAGGG
jgi:methyl-accepting chemotaxis protein